MIKKLKRNIFWSVQLSAMAILLGFLILLLRLTLSGGSLSADSRRRRVWAVAASRDRWWRRGACVWLRRCLLGEFRVDELYLLLDGGQVILDSLDAAFHLADHRVSRFAL